MCGRMFQTLPLKRLLQIARTKNVQNAQQNPTSYNICPTTYIPVIRHSNLYPQDQKHIQKQHKDSNHIQMQEKQEEQNVKNDRELTFMKWGQKTNFNMIINGRIQELSSKRTFMKMIENRCVVIMEGYYEWKQKDKPYCFRPKNSDHFLVAGLYTQNNQIVILTKDAISSLSHVHERMPAMLSQNQVELWLDPKNTVNIQQIIKNSILNKDKPLWKNIGLVELAPHVNKRQQKSRKCLMSIQQYKKQLDKKGLMRFWGKKQSDKKQKAQKQADKVQDVNQDKIDAQENHQIKDIMEDKADNKKQNGAKQQNNAQQQKQQEKPRKQFLVASQQLKPQTKKQ